METPKWLIALVAATSFALAACDNAQKSALQRQEQVQAQMQQITGAQKKETGEQLAKTMAKSQKITEVQTLLKALQGKVKNMPRSVGFLQSKSAKDMKTEWVILKDQLTELRKDLDELVSQEGTFPSDKELRAAINELTKTIDSMISWLGKQ